MQHSDCWCPTGPGRFGLVLPRPTGLEGVWIFFKHWFAQRVWGFHFFSSTGLPNGPGGVWLSTASPNGSEKRFDFFQVLVRPTGLGVSFSFQVLVCPTGLGDSFLSTGSPNGSGGVSDFSSSTGSPNGSGGFNFFKYWFAMRSDPGIFNFVKWLRVGEEACPTPEQAKARLKELFPSKPGWPDTTLVISHSKRMAVNAAANRALASKLLELETQVIHIDLGCYEAGTAGCSQTQHSPQSMRVWPGLRLIGAGGKIPKGVFVAVAEVEPDGVRLDNGMRLKNQEPAEPRSYLRQLPVRLPGVLPPHAAPPVRGRLTGDKRRAAGTGSTTPPGAPA